MFMRLIENESHFCISRLLGGGRAPQSKYAESDSKLNKNQLIN
jgi:hypothetical protein